MKNKKNIILVNAVTSLRVLGIFFLFPIYLSYGALGLALTNIFCFLTDFIDGKMARKLDASTFFGSFFDGFSDKAFVAMNFLILVTITPWALIPIFLELGIAGTQYLKYKNNLDVQSNIIGKVKMWVVGVIVVLANLLMSADALTFLGNNVINKIASISNVEIVKKSLIPLVLSEIVTLTSYIMEFVKGKEKQNENLKEEKGEEITEVKEKEELKKTRDYTLKDVMFDHDFYVEHHNESPLKLIRNRIKK